MHISHSLSLSLSLQRPEPPVKSNEIPREIPKRSCLAHLVPSSLIGGILPFGCIFIQLYFILNSLWYVKLKSIAHCFINGRFSDYIHVEYKQGGSLRSPPACICVCLHVLLNLVRHMVWNSLCIPCTDSSSTMSR